jgi:prephenate dehydrogenase
MKIQIVGNGSFGTFLSKFLDDAFDIVDEADVVVLAVPILAYSEVSAKHLGKTLVNVCSVQKEPNEIIKRHTDSYIGIHPLFGTRSPSTNRNSILTTIKGENAEKFLGRFESISNVHEMSDIEHDQLMAKTHGASITLAKQAKEVIDSVGDVPDYLVPNSFKLLRDFVKTLEDMPKGTIESILSNPYLTK